MTPNSIKALMALRGMSLNGIADAIGRSKNEVSMVISGYRSTPKIRQELAKHLGVPVGELFDAEFDAVIAHRKAKAAA